MNPAYAKPLCELLQTQQVAALGTFHDGQPYVSMVPFAVLPGGSGFVIHVSQLATLSSRLKFCFSNCWALRMARMALTMCSRVATVDS
jgi:hypothetical protein